MRSGLSGKNVVVGISGGIAAYKSVELVRLLIQQDASVRMIMTQNACAFVGPLTFEALTRQPVCTSLYEKSDDASIRHIEWAQETDVVVIAPATANIIGKLANGIADDALSTFMLAVTSPVMVCPSMNTHMYEHRAVQRNLEKLRQIGYLVMQPESGKLACGTTGPGRLPEPQDILDRLLSYLAPKDLCGKRLLVTAGPTQEAIDPVRFISNPSSGKMGYAVARAAEQRGAEVTLITGPTHLPDPLNVTLIKVQSAQEMAAAVFEHFDPSHIIVKTAAVSDYRPKIQADQKMKKKNDEMVIVLQQNQDILKELGRRKGKAQVLVGFAAETQELEKNASKKMEEKNLDIIVGNLVGRPSSGFGADTNDVILFYRDGTQEHLGIMEKDKVSHTLLDRILERFRANLLDSELSGFGQ
jgi:phosphopantothenoylcysteine decarboxylase/phosphopantothenate--cysteine ligase